MLYPTTCIHKISYLSNQSSYNHLLLHFIHFKFTEVLERALLSDRRVDYNHNDVFKCIASPVVFIETFWLDETLEPWLLIGGGPQTTLLVGWDGLRWSGDLPVVISSFLLVFLLGNIQHQGWASSVLKSQTSEGVPGHSALKFYKHKVRIVEYWQKDWNKDGKLRKVWSYRKPHMGSPGQRWTPPCFLVIQYF